MSVHRVEVRPRAEAGDPRGRAALAAIELSGQLPCPSRIDTASVYLIEGDLGDTLVQRIAEALLSHPVTDEAVIGSSSPR